METGNDPLVEIPIEEWPNLMEYFAKDWPRSIVMFGWVNLRLDWLKEGKKSGVSKIYSPKGDINNGLVFFGKVGRTPMHITVYTQNDNLDELREAVLKTKCIDWSVNPIFGLPTEHNDWYIGIVNVMGRTVEENLPTHYYKLPKEKALALEVNCPTDVYIAPLKPENVAEINMIWPHGFKDSEYYLEDIIQLNYGRGVFSKQDNSLLSWVLKYEFGDIGVLQTKDEHMRKGYAALAVKALSKQMALDGIDPYVYIFTENFPSINLFKKIGFEYAGSYDWVVSCVD